MVRPQGTTPMVHATLPPLSHDSPNPDFRLQARRMRVYEGDRVIMRDVVFYVGQVPIFYWPYVYQSLDDSFNFLVSPSFISSWGPSLLGHVTFPITDKIKETVRLDLRGQIEGRIRISGNGA